MSRSGDEAGEVVSGGGPGPSGSLQLAVFWALVQKVNGTARLSTKTLIRVISGGMPSSSIVWHALSCSLGMAFWFSCVGVGIL